MADSDERLRSIRFPQSLWDAIDADASRCKRSSVRQMEVVLSIFYGLSDASIDADKVRAIPGSVAIEQGGKEQPHINGTEIAPRSKKRIAVANATKSKRKSGAG